MDSVRVRSIARDLEGWGRYPRHTAHVYRPERLSEIPTTLEMCPHSLIARGMGRSYGDAALNRNEGVLLTTRLGCLLAFDETDGTLTCEAGTGLPDILQVLLPRGWFLPVTPGTKYATVGGCIAADVHGKNHHLEGSFGNHLLWLDLLLANGKVVRCSPSENSDLFWATVGGMGLTGIIVRASFRLKRVETAYLRVDYHRTQSLEETLHYLDTEDQNYNYSVAWVDTMASGRDMGRAVLMRGDHATLSDLDEARSARPLEVRDSVLLNLPFDLPGVALNRWTIRVMNALYYRSFQEGHSSTIQHYNSFFYPLDAVGAWNRGYGSHGFLQHQCSLPVENARSGLEQILTCISSTGNGSFLAVLKRFGEGSGLISFPMPGYTLALDFPMRGELTLAFQEELDAIVLRHGGRLYLAKDARMKAEDLPQMYPRLGAWLKIRREVDPKRRFSSSLSRRLKLDGVES